MALVHWSCDEVTLVMDKQYWLLHNKAPFLIVKCIKETILRLNTTLIFIVTETKLTRSIVQQIITARMIIVRVNIVCLCVLAFACCAESGCSCGPQHPQQALCDDKTFGKYGICMFLNYLLVVYMYNLLKVQSFSKLPRQK